MPEHIAITSNQHATVSELGDDSANIRLQILTAEHWSLMSTRWLTYSESLNRVIMFLSVLSGSVVALGSNRTGWRPSFMAPKA